MIIVVHEIKCAKAYAAYAKGVNDQWNMATNVGSKIRVKNTDSEFVTRRQLQFGGQATCLQSKGTAEAL